MLVKIAAIAMLCLVSMVASLQPQHRLVKRMAGPNWVGFGPASMAGYQHRCGFGCFRSLAVPAVAAPLGPRPRVAAISTPVVSDYDDPRPIDAYSYSL